MCIKFRQAYSMFLMMLWVIIMVKGKKFRPVYSMLLMMMLGVSHKIVS